MLERLQRDGVNPVDVLERFLRLGEAGAEPLPGGVAQALAGFWAAFDRASTDEWFDSPRAIETYFDQLDNFRRLIEQEFDKLNILFSVIVLKDHKDAFDAGLLATAQTFSASSDADLQRTADFTFARFPSLEDPRSETLVADPERSEGAPLRLVASQRRRELRELIARSGDRSLSKILNTGGISLRDLRFSVDAGASAATVAANAAGGIGGAPVSVGHR